MSTQLSASVRCSEFTLTVGLKWNNWCFSQNWAEQTGSCSCGSECVHQWLHLLFIGQQFAEQPQKSHQSFSPTSRIKYPSGVPILDTFYSDDADEKFIICPRQQRNQSSHCRTINLLVLKCYDIKICNAFSLFRGVLRLQSRVSCSQNNHFNWDGQK